MTPLLFDAKTRNRARPAERRRKCAHLLHRQHRVAQVVLEPFCCAGRLSFVLGLDGDAKMDVVEHGPTIARLVATWQADGWLHEVRGVYRHVSRAGARETDVSNPNPRAPRQLPFRASLSGRTGNLPGADVRSYHGRIR